MYTTKCGTTTPQEDDILNKVGFGEFARKKLSILEVFIAHQLSEGFNVTETADRLGININYCSRTVQKMKIKFRNYLN